MPVKITILSGSRQGEILEFDQAQVVIGELPRDDIRFDRGSDPGIRDRRASLTLDGDGWKVRNGGTTPLFLNQDHVVDVASVRSGDYVRISHDGPDLCFELIGTLSAPPPALAEAPVRSAPLPQTEPSRTAAGSFTGNETSSAPAGCGWAIAIAAAVTCLLVAVGMSVLAWRWVAPATTPAVASAPELVPFGVMTLKEGENLFWRPTLTSSNAADRFELGRGAPKGMSIDPITGTVKWTTTEADGPGEYSCELLVTRTVGDQALSDSQTLEISVQEVNRPPTVAAIPTQEANLRRTRDFEVTLQASDPDAPAQTLSFHLRPGAPDGMSLDAQTGELRWRVDPKYANQEVAITFRVTDDAFEPLSTDGALRVKVTLPDAWTAAESELSGCVYLILTETKPGKLVVPLGTGCAIAETKLLTSASVASAINDASGRGWTVLAVDTRDFDLRELRGLELQGTESHAVYVRAEAIEDEETKGLQQAFFDLAILTTNQQMPQTCRLGDVQTSIKRDQTVACFGYEVPSGSLTQFDSPKPLFTKVKVLDVITPPNEAAIRGRPPLLLQLIGELPFQPFGSVIVNEDAEVLGIYAFRGQLPEGVNSEPVHYAPDAVHAKAYLAGQGLSLWKSADPSRTKPGAN